VHVCTKLLQGEGQKLHSVKDKCGYQGYVVTIINGIWSNGIRFYLLRVFEEDNPGKEPTQFPNWIRHEDLDPVET